MNAAVTQTFARLWTRLAGLLRRPTAQACTELGRAQRRHQRMAFSAAASAAARVISVSTALISVPLTLHYLGPERYGMWMTMTSLIAMMSFADLGLGNGILSLVATASGHDDHDAIQRYVSSGLSALSLIAGVLLGLWTLSYPWVPWHQIFNVQTELARHEAGPALAVFVLVFVLNLPLSVASRTLMGLQKGFTVSLWQCAGSLLSLAGVLLVIRVQGSLPWLVLAVMGGPLLATMINNIQFFGILHPMYRPRWRSVRMADIRQISRTGALFFVLQIVVAIAYTSDNVLIAQTLGAAAVPAYAVPEKMFSLITVTLSMVLAPLWPAYGEAIARGDATWVKRTLKRSMKLAIGSAASLSLILVLIAPQLLAWWVGHVIEPSYLLLAGLGLWKVVEAAGGTLATFLNGARVVRLQIILAIATAATTLLFKLTALHVFSLSALPWAMTASFLLATLIPYMFFLPGILSNIRPTPPSSQPSRVET